MGYFCSENFCSCVGGLKRLRGAKSCFVCAVARTGEALEICDGQREREDLVQDGHFYSTKASMVEYALNHSYGGY